MKMGDKGDLKMLLQPEDCSHVVLAGPLCSLEPHLNIISDILKSILNLMGSQ